MKKADIVVVGGSAAGLTAAITARRHYPEETALLVCKEKQVLIPCGIPYIFGTVGSPQKNLIGDKVLEENKMELLLAKATDIDLRNKILPTTAGDVGYQRLVLATGSRPAMPPIPGFDLEGVYAVVKDVPYLSALQARLETAKDVVIIGGGFFGIEFADEIKKNGGKNITVIEIMSHCLGLAYDEEFCVEMEEVLESRGIKILTSAKVEKISGNGTVEKVTLSDGTELKADAFSGNVKGMGPGVAEMAFEERKSEPVIIFMADKTSAGAWNLPLYKMFADPFNTAGLIIAPAMHAGFRFEVHDVKERKQIVFDTPEEIYDLLVFIGAPGRYVIKAVYTKDGEIAGVSSTQRLTLIAGKYVGKDDPVCIVRCQSQFPAVGEMLEPFTMPHIVEGWMRGSHHGPLMPVPVHSATPSRFDGPPRVIALGFQIADGRLAGPRDMFDDPGFDEARRLNNTMADHLRRHGPFEPHRLPIDEMEYTTLPQVMERLEGRWEKSAE